MEKRRRMRTILLILLRRLLHTIGIYTISEVEFMGEPIWDPKTGYYNYPVKLHKKVYKMFYITVYKKKV